VESVRAGLVIVKVMLIGDGAAGTRTLQALHRAGVQIVAVMAIPAQQNVAGSLWKLAAKLGYQTWPAPLVKDPSFSTQVRQCETDIIINVHSLFLLTKEVLNTPCLGSYNLHPGPLPRYAGLNSVCWAIYRGERQYGVTLHRMEPEIDAGPIVYRQSVEIGNEDTGLSLTAKCTNVGVPLVLQLLEVAAKDPGSIPLFSQDLSKREYFGRQVPDHGNLFWNRPARRIVDFVRACDFFPFSSPWGHPRTRLGNREFGIVKARSTGHPADATPGSVGESGAEGVRVASRDEWVHVRQVFCDGKYLPARATLVPGDKLEDPITAMSTKAEVSK
jgi:methionyl-tRNA formyltransferase